MSNEISTPAETQIENTGAIPVVARIANEVKSSVASQKNKPYEILINAMAEKVINERVGLLQQGFDLRERTNGEMRGVKPDNVAFDINGKVISESYTKAQADKFKQVKTSLEKIDKALEAAIDNADFGPLKQVLGNNKQ